MSGLNSLPLQAQYTHTHLCIIILELPFAFYAIVRRAIRQHMLPFATAKYQITSVVRGRVCVFGTLLLLHLLRHTLSVSLALLLTPLLCLSLFVCVNYLMVCKFAPRLLPGARFQFCG